MSAWPEPVERVAAALRAAAVEARIEEFPDGTPTARTRPPRSAASSSQIVKSLVFVCDGAYVLALVPGDRRADEAAVAAAVGAAEVADRRARTRSLQATGFEPGGVAPFPQRAVTRTLIDKRVLPPTSGLDRRRLAGPHGGAALRSSCSACPGRVRSTSRPHG